MTQQHMTCTKDTEMTAELKQRAEALRKELDALDKAIAKSHEKTSSAYGLFDPGKDEAAYLIAQPYITGGAYYVFPAVNERLNALYGKQIQAKAVYREEAQAKAVAHAFNVFFRELPMCEGVVVPRENHQYLINPLCDLSGIYAEEYTGLYFKVARLSPTFDTKENAKAAIEKVGADRILRAFKALKGMS